jgi:hypothetical protein
MLRLRVKSICTNCELSNDSTIILYKQKFIDIIEQLCDEVTLCPHCGKNSGEIAKLTLCDNRQEFEIPLYKGPLN